MRASIELYGAELKRRLAPADPFGIGLRLSDIQTTELLTGDALPRFGDRLEELGVYVCAINGFPYGEFHSGRVKDDVHRPDWRSEQRVAYTLNLATILAKLMPPESHGGISTSPLSYKPWGSTSRTDWSLMTANIASVAGCLSQLSDKSGVDLHLDIEPEPDGLIATSGEYVGWFQNHLEKIGTRAIEGATGLSGDDACDELRRRISVCLDTCHAAVEFEEPSAVLDNYAKSGIRIGRVQASSALKIAIPRSPTHRLALGAILDPFADSTYLHQTIGRTPGGSLERWSDLPEALQSLHETDCDEWRVHYHVPIFLHDLGVLSTTQEQTQELIRLVRQRGLCDLFEVETYTWSILPRAMRMDLTDSIERELRWLIGELSEVEASL